MLFRSVPPAFLLVMCCILAGCGGGGGDGAADYPATVAVSGVVLFNGSPLAEATVTFNPDVPVGTIGAYSAVGRTDSEGRFTLRTQFASGCVPGNYKVTFTKLTAGATRAPDVDESQYVPPAEDTGDRSATTGDQLPAYLGNPLTTTESVVVEAGRDNRFEFNLGN